MQARILRIFKRNKFTPLKSLWGWIGPLASLLCLTNGILLIFYLGGQISYTLHFYLVLALPFFIFGVCGLLPLIIFRVLFLNSQKND